MTHILMLAVGVGAGLMLRSIPLWWRSTRQAQAAQKPEYAVGSWFTASPPPPAPSQAQRADAPVINKYTLRSVPARRALRRRGR